MIGCNLFIMSPRRRSFSFILIFLALNNGPALCQTVGPGVPQIPGPIPNEYGALSGSPKSQLLNTLLTIASANGVLSNVLPSIQRIFPESQNLIVNEGIQQEVPNGQPCQQCFTPNLPFNSLPPPQSNFGTINPYTAAPKLVANEGLQADVTNRQSSQQWFAPNLVVTNPSPYPIPQTSVPNPQLFLPSYPILQPTSPPAFASPPFIPQAPQTVPPIPIADQNYNCIGPLPINGFSGLQPVRQSDILPPNCNFQPEFIQPQFNLQIPQMLPPAFPTPPVLPKPNPVILPSQNTGSWSYIPESNAIPMSTPIEVPVTNVGSNIDTATYDQQLPLPISLQISMPAPVIPEPIITVISTSSPAPDNSLSFNVPSFMPPIQVVEKSRSRWKSWLPIILLALLDGGCGNNCGGGCSGCQCGSNIPIPYPIPIPTNNPIIIGCQVGE